MGRNELVIDPNSGQQAESVEETINEFPSARLQVVDNDTAQEEVHAHDKDRKYKRRYQLCLLCALLYIPCLVLVVVELLQIADVQIVGLLQVALLQLLLELVPLSLQPHTPLLLLHQDLIITAVATL